MRSYNFKKNKKEKETKKRKDLYGRGYWPTMPNLQTKENGDEYYVQGKPDNTKKFVKKQAVKAIRNNKCDTIKSGSSYKKNYDLWWEWF